MALHWQSITAVGIVVITLTVFLVRLARPKAKGGGCGHDCGCGKKPGH
jgi:hypothetical protein